MPVQARGARVGVVHLCAVLFLPDIPTTRRMPGSIVASCMFILLRTSESEVEDAPGRGRSGTKCLPTRFGSRGVRRLPRDWNSGGPSDQVNKSIMRQCATWERGAHHFVNRSTRGWRRRATDGGSQCWRRAAVVFSPPEECTYSGDVYAHKISQSPVALTCSDAFRILSGATTGAAATGCCWRCVDVVDLRVWHVHGKAQTPA